jgi:hypothetical protein
MGVTGPTGECNAWKILKHINGMNSKKHLFCQPLEKVEMKALQMPCTVYCEQTMSRSKV